MHPEPLAADVVLTGGDIVTLDAACPRAQALAVRDGRIVAVGADAAIRALAGPHTRVHDLGGRTVIPGLVDAHAHLDREGLKRRLPSLAAIDSIDMLVALLADLARGRPSGAWIVTMPFGTPPFYQWRADDLREQRLPTRHDLDRASRDHPIFIRPPWGYWPSTGPNPCFANSAALKAAGIDRTTQSPSPKLVIDRDSAGEPTGVFWEHERMPLAELTLFAQAPNFSDADRYDALLESMRLYNAMGTTSVVEGHGAAPALVRAWQAARAAGRQSVRAHLVMSPGWGDASADDVVELMRGWTGWLRGRGLGDAWLAMSGLYTEIDDGRERLLRARCAPQTGWAGFLYDSGLPREAVRALVIEAARNGIRVSGVYQNLLELYREADKVAPIGGQRWILGHQMMLDREQIALIRDLGVGLTLHTNAHIYKRGAALVSEAGPQRENDIVPVRRLLDAGVKVALGTDNVPYSVFGTIAHVVGRRDRNGVPVAPGQAISAHEALECASVNGAWLSFDESIKGRLQPEMLADLVILERNPLDCTPDEIAAVTAAATMVEGRWVYCDPSTAHLLR
jgi:predicted amidohydrolase YtcJ